MSRGVSKLFLLVSWFCGTLHPWRNHCGTEVSPWVLDGCFWCIPLSPLILAFLVPCSTQPYNTTAILCSLACASQVLILSCFWDWPCDDSCLAAYQRLHLELAQSGQKGAVLDPEIWHSVACLLFSGSLTAFQGRLTMVAVRAYVCQPPCQAHKFTSILEEGEREVTFHRVAGTPGDVGR